MSFIDFSYNAYTFCDPTIINPFSPFQYQSVHLPNDTVLINPKHRHDGTSPLPLGMDWSLPPSIWDGRNSVWPHDPHTGWSFCVTVPSWVDVPQSTDSDPVVFYRVQVGIQSPQGITTSRVILRRFNDFLNMFSDLKKEFPEKNLPSAPPKKIMRIKSHALLEERRCLLADWMEKLLSDIDLSRSAPVAIFLELEAAARSAFHDMNQHISDEISTLPDNSCGSVKAPCSSVASNSDKVTPYEDRSMQNTTVINSTEETLDRATSNKDFIFEHNGIDKVTSDTLAPGMHDYKLNDHVKRLSMESTGGDLSSLGNSETSNSAATTSIQDDSRDLPVSHEPSENSDSLITSRSDERPKLNRILNTQQQGLTTAETNVEDLIARLNQEMAARQYLITKVKDLEIELETTRVIFRENMQQAVLTEKERFTQMQWDTEEFRRKCLEMEAKLKSEEDERLLAESTKTSVIQEKQMLQQDLDVAREQIEHLMKNHDEFVMKSKTDTKLLITEVNSLRSSQLELKQQLSELMKEKLDVESLLHEEKQRMKLSHNVNSKLVHECAILHKRLEECNVNFLVEEEDKVNILTSKSDALDLLATSDNQIGILLAEAQLLAEDVESDTTYDDLKKMLAHVFVDNGSLRKQINSVIRCALNAKMNS
ncbi:PREDICTED: uncharacterized protein LOC109342802 isoform X1 [Lupinus angustifolius]|uniref:uncharacterized protein LOC109342802 isoform X1 n=1 Tax=Lupinus angustifolius TaxID=3871 RepID=UPI00092FD762|nr:PREDICTED: uncharacterized protein LOC109342802 isoform X1 [Lupinus angustifolius]